MAGLGLTETGLSRLVRDSPRLLRLVTLSTIVGPEVRAWHVPSGTNVPGPPSRSIPTGKRDLSWPRSCGSPTWTYLGSIARVKKAGLLKVEGRDYLVADGDILLFRCQRGPLSRSICF